MTELGREFVFDLRQFRRSPGLAASVAVTIGLGVGPNLAVFALLHDAFFPPTPYQEARRLAIVENSGLYYYEGNVPEGLESPMVSGPDFEDFLSRQQVFEAVGAFAETMAVMGGIDRPRTVSRVFVTATVLDALRPQPVRGRLLAAADFAADAPGVALVTEGLWRSRLASDPAVIGRSITLDEQPFTIAGVLPDQVFGLLVPRRGLFDRGAHDRSVVTPLVRGRAGEGERSLAYSRTHRDAPWLRVVGRLGPGVSMERARTETAVLATRLRAENPSANRSRSFQVVPLDRWRTADVRQLLLMLSLAAGLAFLVAVANAAGLMMTDSVKRQPELAIRQALGAGPAQLLHVVLVRSVLWSLPGAVLGYVFGVAALAFVRWGASAGTETLGTVSVGPVVIAAGLGLTLIAGVATGAVAAWTLRHRDLVQSLHEAGLAVSTGRRRRRVTLVLVAVQVAVATGLAIGSALLVRSMWNVVQADRGFDLDRGFVVQVRLPRSRYPKAADQATYYQQALARVRALPGVVSAGVSASPPLTNTTVMLSGSLKVESPSGDTTLDRMLGQFVTAGYFEAAGLRLVKGRFFSEQDEQSGAPAIVVDEAFCRAHLKGADALSSALHFGRDRLAIVGVVGDVRQDTERQSARTVQYQNRGLAYMLFRRFNGSPTWSFMVVRASVNPATLGEATVRELLAVDHLACLDDPRTFSQLFAARIAERQRILGLLGSLAAIVLLLTALSLAAALAQFVAVHERDLAIRLAVGATRRHVVLLTSRAAVTALGLGLAIGAGGGLALARALESQLYLVEPTDATTILGAMVLLVALALAAAAGPVWRASRIDPATTLRAL